MSVEDFKPGGHIRAFLEEVEGLHPDACFWCGERILSIGVIWAGHGKKVICHPHCAYDLAHELISDARNAIRVIEGKPVNTGVNVKVRRDG